MHKKIFSIILILVCIFSSLLFTFAEMPEDYKETVLKERKENEKHADTVDFTFEQQKAKAIWLGEKYHAYNYWYGNTGGCTSPTGYQDAKYFGEDECSDWVIEKGGQFLLDKYSPPGGITNCCSGTCQVIYELGYNDETWKGFNFGDTEPKKNKDYGKFEVLVPSGSTFSMNDLEPGDVCLYYNQWGGSGYCHTNMYLGDNTWFDSGGVDFAGPTYEYPGTGNSHKIVVGPPQNNCIIKSKSFKPSYIIRFYYRIDDSDNDFSIPQEVITPVMSSLTLTDGSIFTTTKQEKEDRLQRNLSVLHGTATEQYSLYDRFGPKLQFVEYLGESSDSIQLADHIVSAYYNDTLDNLDLKEDIISYNSETYLSTKVYKNRPAALNNELLKSGYKDPRVSLKSTFKMDQLYTMSLAEYRLGITTFIVGVIGLFTTDTFNTFVLENLRALVTSPAWEAVRVGVGFITVFFIIFFIFSIVKHAIEYSKGNGGFGGRAITRVLIGAFSIGLIGVFLAKPTQTIDITSKFVTAGDKLIQQGMVAVKNEDPIITSRDEDGNPNGNNAVVAAIWDTALFEPWCKALFGDTYNNLYTQYSTEGGKMPQSYVKDPSKLEQGGEIFYNSAYCTGDVWVDLGLGKKERNWAAYALSTMSIYHIGSEVYDATDKLVDKTSMNSFPNAKTTANNKNLYADTFRWIDAKMNISPQYFPGEYDTTSSNGSNGISQSAEDVINGACAWAVGIANDNQFHYGNTDGANHDAAHSSGCYFCGTNEHKKKSTIIDPEFTYCCNPFVFSAFAHGGGDPTMLRKCENKGNGNTAIFRDGKTFQDLGKPDFSTLKKGDVLIYADESHYALYLGNNKYVDACGGDTNVKGSKGWNNSIKVHNINSWGSFGKASRYIGNGGGLMESHDAIRENLAFYNYSDAREWETHYWKYSWEMLWKGLLLLALFPVIIKKVKAFLDLMLISIKGVIYALRELYKENTGLHVFWNDIVESFFGYIMFSVQLYFLIYIYVLTVNKAVYFHLFYLIMCYVVSSVRLSDIVWRAKKFKQSIQHARS